MIKKLISVFLAIITLAGILAPTATADSGTKRLWFYIPSSWKNTDNEYYDGVSLDSCAIFLEYTIEGSDNGKTVQLKRDSVYPDLYYYDVDVNTRWVEVKNFDEYVYSQSVNYAFASASCATPKTPYTSDTTYSFYPEPVEYCDNMILVIGSDKKSGQSYCCEWFYYYGDFKYSYFPTIEEAGDSVVGGGEIPKMKPAYVPESEIPKDDNAVFIDTSGIWNKPGTMRLSISQKGGNTLNYKSDHNVCERISDNLYKYSFSNLDETENGKNQIEQGVGYSIRIQMSGYSTPLMTMGYECKGDTIYLTGEYFRLPYDTYNVYYEAKWRNNSDKFGTHIMMGDNGEAIGDFFLIGETPAEILGEWLREYCSLPHDNPDTDALKILVNAYKSLGITSLDEALAAYDYMVERFREDENARQLVIDAYYNAYPYLPEAEPFEDTNACISVLAATSVIGGTVEVPISISDNPGLASLILNVRYDKKVMKLIGVGDGGILGASNHKPELVFPYRLTWENDTVRTNFTGNGVIAVLTFRILSDVEVGEYPVKVYCDYNSNEAVDSELQKVKLNIKNASVTVTDDYIPGDINGDGSVNNLDRAYLTRYIAGWDDYQDIVVQSADLNGDGFINNLDLLILTRHLAKWEKYVSLTDMDN